MLFQSGTFLIFFAVFYAVYLLVKNTRAHLWWLLLGSYVFYGWLDPLYPILLIYITLVVYCSATLMGKTGRKRIWLWFGVLNGLGLLGFFKYAGFFADNLNALFSTLGIHGELPRPGFLFPVGVSFFTFQALAYLFDCYRGNISREPSLLRLGVYVAMFPQLLAGPIERAGNLLPQLAQRPKITGQDIGDGLSLFVVGMFKKVILADYLSLYVNAVYGNPASYAAPALLAATFAFSWQIYFDFSGYTDMARGVARLLGYRLMLNFNNPYLATSLGEFWNRWHISLSSWFKDYVYIPLGGNRKGPARTSLNIALTMVISGLWHGAAWTFVIWGAIHALGRLMTRKLERSPFYQEKVPKFAKQLLVFAIVSFAWIFFKAATLGDAGQIIRKIFTGGWADPAFPLPALVLILAVWAYQMSYESRLRSFLRWPVVRIGLVVAMILIMIVFPLSSEQPFIYFQF